MRTTLILAVVAILAAFSGCNGTESQAPTGKEGASGAGSPHGASPAGTAALQGDVIETMDSGGYTYVLADTGDGPAWYAGPQTSVAVGDTVALPTNGMPMRNFESNTLGRTFDLVYFVGSIGKVGGTKAADAVRGAHGSVVSPTPDMDFSGLDKPEGGLTVAEVFSAGKAAAGREVILRGKVVKVNTGIMGKNWLHVRDGTGDAETNDLTVTTQDLAKVGDTVLITGKLVADRDFGFGYKYDLLIEEAKVVVE